MAAHRTLATSGRNLHPPLTDPTPRPAHASSAGNRGEQGATDEECTSKCAGGCRIRRRRARGGNGSRDVAVGHNGLRRQERPHRLQRPAGAARARQSGRHRRRASGAHERSRLPRRCLVLARRPADRLQQAGRRRRRHLRDPARRERPAADHVLARDGHGPVLVTRGRDGSPSRRTGAGTSTSTRSRTPARMPGSSRPRPSTSRTRRGRRPRTGSPTP